MKPSYRFNIFCLLLALFVGLLSPFAAIAQTPVPTPLPPASTPVPTPIDPDEVALSSRVDSLIAEMSVADRVGQLFMVGFQGGSAGYESDIAELVYGYRVGGVILSPENGNFTNEAGVDTSRQVATLVNRLQAMAYGLLLPADSALQPLDESVWPPAGSVSMEQVTNVEPVNLPLLIAVEQGGDGLTATSLRRGFTPLPSLMALGATWNSELVNRVGQIVGRELRAVGINMLLGPNLDVLSQPRADNVGALGLHMFGGDPYWVSQMGRAYIAGVHSGGNGHVATVARHFPGAGDADRLPDQEVATVQRSLEELERFTLPPFQAVTRGQSSVLNPEGDPATTDAMMSSHIRYAGLQGASLGRSTPISLAPELEAVLAREGFVEWRRQGGLMVSNILGAPAIRRYYDPTLQQFPYRQVAMDAFTAGHDLLLLDRFSLDEQWENEKQNIEETISFFQERYTLDPDFAAQVDDSVRRIVTLKLRLYSDSDVDLTDEESSEEDSNELAATPVPTDSAGGPPVPLSKLLVTEASLDVLKGDSRASAMVTVGQVARESFTVLYPDPTTASEVVSVVPQVNDQLLVIAPHRELRDCPSCASEVVLQPETIVEIIQRLYGTSGTGQLNSEQINSITFAELAELLAVENELSTTTLLGPTSEQSPAPSSEPANGIASSPAITTDVPTTQSAEVLLTPEVVAEEAEPTLDVTAEDSADIVNNESDAAGNNGDENEIVTTAEVRPSVEGTGEISPSALLTEPLRSTYEAVEAADWLIFVMLDISPEHPDSDVVKRFLNNRSAQLAQKRVIVLALHAPYFLDATEISKLNGYYGVYSKTQPFLESAVRALFRAYTPSGAPPVPVAGTRFAALNERLAPDPDRTIEIQILSSTGELLIGQESTQTAALPVADNGQLVRILAGPIYDRNGKPVRNGTAVDVTVTYEDDGVTDMQTVPTQSGVAVRDVVLNRGGLVRITARAGEASADEDVGLSVQSAPVAEDVAANATPPLTATAAVTTPVEVADANPAAGEADADESENKLAALFIALTAMLATLSFFLILQVGVLPRTVLVNNLLWALNCGLVAYIIYGLGWLPGGNWLHESLRIWGAAVVVFIAMLLPLVWLQLRTNE